MVKAGRHKRPAFLMFLKKLYNKHFPFIPRLS